MVSIDLSGPTAAALSKARSDTGLSSDPLIFEAISLLLERGRRRRKDARNEKLQNDVRTAADQVNPEKTRRQLQINTSPGDVSKSPRSNKSTKQRPTAAPQQNDLFDD